MAGSIDINQFKDCGKSEDYNQRNNGHCDSEYRKRVIILNIPLKSLRYQFIWLVKQPFPSFAIYLAHFPLMQ